jgi:hypothetical protein
MTVKLKLKLKTKQDDGNKSKLLQHYFVLRMINEQMNVIWTIKFKDSILFFRYTKLHETVNLIRQSLKNKNINTLTKSNSQDTKRKYDKP